MADIAEVAEFPAGAGASAMPECSGVVLLRGTQRAKMQGQARRPFAAREPCFPSADLLGWAPEQKPPGGPPFPQQAKGDVELRLAVVRLPHVTSDVLITLHTPPNVQRRAAAPVSSRLRRGVGGATGALTLWCAAHPPRRMRLSDDEFKAIAASFRIVDWGLFGGG